MRLPRKLIVCNIMTAGLVAGSRCIVLHRNQQVNERSEAYLIDRAFNMQTATRVQLHRPSTNLRITVKH
jgi:hypothetical protein